MVSDHVMPHVLVSVSDGIQPGHRRNASPDLSVHPTWRPSPECLLIRLSNSSEPAFVPGGTFSDSAGVVLASSCAWATSAARNAESFERLLTIRTLSAFKAMANTIAKVTFTA